MRKKFIDPVSLLKKNDVAADTYLLSRNVLSTVRMYEDLCGFIRKTDMHYAVTELNSASSLRKQRLICSDRAQLIEEILDDLRAAMSDESFEEVERGGGKWLEQPVKEISANCINRAFALYEEASGTSTRGEGRRPARMISCLIRSCEALQEDKSWSIPDLSSDPGKLQALRFIYARNALICVLALFAFEYAADILKRQRKPDAPEQGSGPAHRQLLGSADEAQPQLTSLQQQERAPGTDHDDLPSGGRLGRRYHSDVGRRSLMFQKVPALLKSIYEAVRKLKDTLGTPYLVLPKFPEG